MVKPILLTAPSVTLQAAKAKGPPRVEILAYSGALMAVPGWGPVAIDLTRLDLSGDIPLLADHENRVAGTVGTGRASVRQNQLHVEGTLTRATEAGRQVLDLHRDGIALQASVGVDPTQQRFIREGEKVHVNGRAVSAPRHGATLIEAGKLLEVSLTPLGADAETSVSIAARRKQIMDFQEWLTARGFDPKVLTETQTVPLKAAYDAEHNGGGVAAATNGADPVQAEQERQAGVLRATHGLPEIQSMAIQQNWPVEKAELEALRARRPMAPAAHTGGRYGGVNAPEVLEAALLGHLGAENIAEKELGAEVAQRGRDMHANHVCDILQAGLRATGFDRPMTRDKMIRTAFSPALQAAGEATGFSLSGILSNVANKLLLDSYRAFPSVVQRVAKKLSANDFKTATGYRLTGNAQFDELGPKGEIEHGTLDEDSFTYSVNTYAKMFGLERTDIINDDLGAFAEIPRKIGRGAALKVEDVFWTLVLANTGDFFHNDNSNMITDALAAAGLASGVEKFLQQTDADGHPINVLPKWLLTPAELKVTGDELYASRAFYAGGSGTSTDDKLPGANPFFGLYQPLTSPYLSNSSYTGYSATAWYLFGDPADVAAFGVAYLNGNQAPTVESADADFNTLGLLFRGYLDFGVCQVDHRGGVKSTGAG